MERATKTYKVTRVNGTTIAEVRVVRGGEYTDVKWDGDDEFERDDDGLEMLNGSNGLVTEI